MDDKLDEVEKSVALIDARLQVHMAEEEGEFTGIHAKLDTLQADLSEHVAEHKESAKNFRKGFLGLIFTVIGIILSAAWEFIRGHVSYNK